MKNIKFSASDLEISNLGEQKVSSPLHEHLRKFIDEDDRIVYEVHVKKEKENGSLSLEQAGPREKLFFDPKKVNSAIVTCGGLCPGINDVIRAIVYESYEAYGVSKVYGFRFGFKGMIKQNKIEPLLLNTDIVNDIHEKGGTILGSSRGMQDVGKIVDYLEELKISILYTIGGDGTSRGAADLAEEIIKRGLKIAVVAIPKTIDNDISFIEKTFGFETAVEVSRDVIASAHIESKGAENGIGIVKLMGRDSGFIAAQATISNSDVNFCLVPEEKFTLEGKNGLLPLLEKRLKKRGHAVIVVAEGAGQNLLAGKRKKDSSGNILHEDIGVFLKDKIKGYFKKKNFPSSVKYIDPSYIIRSKPANAKDSLYCLQFGQNGVHAAMAGKTNIMIGYWNNHYTHIPIRLATKERKKIDPNDVLWQTILSITEQGKSR